MKYAHPRFSNDEDKEFCKYFAETFTSQMLESHLQLLFRRKTHFVGSRTLNFSIKFVSSCIKSPKAMEKLHPFLSRILYEIVIPVMLVTHKDVVLFRDDPIEYIRKQEDFTETIFMPKANVLDLL